MTEFSAKSTEWRASWPLPMIAMIGITGPAAFSYASGVFMLEMTRDFGWTKTQFSSGLVAAMVFGMFVAPFAARLLDHVGSRRMLLFGIVPFACGLSLLGLANGDKMQWWLLCVVYSILTLGVIPAAWMGGIVANFNAARGLAMAFCLAGIGIATAFWPKMAAILVENFGWQASFAVMGFAWAALLLPLTYFFYKPIQHTKPNITGPEPDKISLKPAILSRDFWLLLGAGGLFAGVQLALLNHLVPIFMMEGLSLSMAANLAVIAGICSIIGRIGTGALLDFLPTRPIAFIAFTLPFPVLMLLYGADGSTAMLVAAAALLGFASGSETDVVAYMCSRRYDKRIFGTIYTLFQTGFAVFAVTGPLIASRVYDVTGNYDQYYLMASFLIAIATLCIMLVPPEEKPVEVC